MPTTRPDDLVRRFVDRDPTAAAALAEQARTSTDPGLLVAAALADPPGEGLLRRAVALAGSARDRRLVAIAATYLSGAADQARLLARDHLADHPDSLLAAHLAAVPRNEKRNR